MTISWIVFACLFGGALLGMLIRGFVPQHHLSADSKDTIKVGMGLIATMAALVLGLMVGSTKSSYDAQKSELTQMSAKIVLLDRALAHYGPETKETRDLVRRWVVRTLEQIWVEDSSWSEQAEPTSAVGDAVYDKLLELKPEDQAQRALQVQSQNIALDIAKSRWLLFVQTGSAISTPFLVVLVFWLTLNFVSFGLFAPRNATVIATLLLGALSVSGAIFLILELDRPFGGLIQISSDPLRKALASLGL